MDHQTKVHGEYYLKIGNSRTALCRVCLLEGGEPYISQHAHQHQTEGFVKEQEEEEDEVKEEEKETNVKEDRCQEKSDVSVRYDPIKTENSVSVEDSSGKIEKKKNPPPVSGGQTTYNNPPPSISSSHQQKYSTTPPRGSKASGRYSESRKSARRSPSQDYKRKSPRREDCPAEARRFPRRRSPQRSPHRQDFMVVGHGKDRKLKCLVCNNISDTRVKHDQHKVAQVVYFSLQKSGFFFTPAHFLSQVIKSR